ncbi:single-stranded-DNA-specific exonuclease RecJ [Sutcliffiella cohnii]
MLLSKSRWNIKKPNEEKVKELVDTLKVTPLIATLLVNRGIEDVEEASSFLNINEMDFHDPFLLEDMEIVVERIKTAVQKEEKILVFGDYDADGVSSTTVLLTALQEIGARADFYIPNRFTEGYGPNETAFRWAKEQNYTLIITVDTGISAHHEGEVAKELGLDLIITDHHEPSPTLPESYAIIHPKKTTCSYPYKELAGVGVAFKVAHALLGRVPEHLIEIAAIGTIADLVPLTGENRLIAYRGIRQMKSTTRPGLRALFQKCGVDMANITEETIGFTIGPRINAVGRLADADPAVHLLMATTYEEAVALVEEIDGYNKERQQIVAKITEEAIKQVEEKYPPEEHSFIIVEGYDWNAGVIGIVASRLVDKFYRPTIVLSLDDKTGLAKGSARSIKGFDLFEHLSDCRDILPHFGGHPMAAGMTLEMKNVHELRTRMNRKASEILTEEDFIPITDVDMQCELEDISLQTIEQLERLAPYGVANPKPKVVVPNASLQQIRQIGSNNTHLKLMIEKNNESLDCVGFGFGDAYHEISPSCKIHVLGELSINEWNNIRKPQLFIQDIKIDEWQLFDIRSSKQLSNTLKQLNKEKARLVHFSSEALHDLPIAEEWKSNSLHIVDIENYRFSEETHLILLDLPTDEEQLISLIKLAKPTRIYASFYQRENHFFSTIPTRDHFKWFYSLIMKKGSIDLNRYAEDIAKTRGWSKETVEFISQVFFELEFVTIDNGFISLNSGSMKRDLTESRTYQKKQKQIELENKFLYSTYHQLKTWFDEHVNELRTVYS